MAEAQLGGLWRQDGHIELTGSKGAFRTVGKRTGVTFLTIPYPASEEAPAPQRLLEQALAWVRLVERPERERLALVSRATFEAAGLAPYVTLRNDPAPPPLPDTAKATGEMLKALVLDRRDTLKLEHLPQEIETRLATTLHASTLQDTLEGKPGPRSKPLNAMLLVLHAHKPITPGELGKITGHLNRELDTTLCYLLRLPHARFLDAYRGEQIRVSSDGTVTLAGLVVSPETAVVVPEEARWSKRRDWSRDRNYGNRGGNLRYYAGGRDTWRD